MSLVWSPPVETSEAEERRLSRCKKAKLFVFLRRRRHELFDDEFQRELRRCIPSARAATREFDLVSVPIDHHDPAWAARGHETHRDSARVIEDPSFASFLAGQWIGMIDSGLVGEHLPGRP